MRFKHAKGLVVALWILILMVAGLATPVTSMAGWAALVAVALISIWVLQKFWRDPSQTMSESIQQARR